MARSGIDAIGDTADAASGSGDRSLVALLKQLADVGEPTRQVRFDNNAAGDPLYMGEAPPGAAVTAAAWRIRKFTYDAFPSPVTMLWAGGDLAFTKVWNDRASLVYS